MGSGLTEKRQVELMQSPNKHCRLAIRIGRRTAHDTERGIVILEAALGMLGLAFLIACLVDLSIVLMGLMMLEQAAREGVRTASRLSQMDTGQFVNQDVATPPANPADPYDPRQNLIDCAQVNRNNHTVGFCNNVMIHSRIRHILRLHGSPEIDWETNPVPLWGINVADVVITSEYRNKTYSGGVGTSPNTVLVELTGTCHGIFFPYNITATSSGPYLF